MLQLDAELVARLLDRPALIEALDAAFRAAITVPSRHHHTLTEVSGRASTLLLMPAWDDSAYIGIKIATIMPENAARSLPAVQATYMLLDRLSGRPLAIMDGAEITARRTAAASALAARYLARSEASHLLMVGTGVLAPHLIASHAAVRPLTRVSIWGRNGAKAEALAERLSETGSVNRDGEPIEFRAVFELQDAVPDAHIISCATLTEQPLICGDWLVAGQHLDLVGAFTPHMREADDVAIRRARVYVDTPTCITEAGEICQPIADGVLDAAAIQGDLFSLASGAAPLRLNEGEITLFKSAGTAIEDLAAAQLAYERHQG
ncbi:MAG: ornithine cyclodeaminase family protein [Rhodospirillales bacterium]|nr:ornithine cyclodeaminase family protein [Rhodospirillales bacterium]